MEATGIDVWLTNHFRETPPFQHSISNMVLNVGLTYCVYIYTLRIQVDYWLLFEWPFRLKTIVLVRICFINDSRGLFFYWTAWLILGKVKLLFELILTTKPRMNHNLLTIPWSALRTVAFFWGGGVHIIKNRPPKKETSAIWNSETWIFNSFPCWPFLGCKRRSWFLCLRFFVMCDLWLREL